ncbi:MAG: FtsX-like permease family protein [Proteobacteria bacterium]|nr:FtsX-like permease family protein [Pseudomonadota bacterium]
MKYLPLIASALWRRPTETVFTFLAVTAGFILFASMMGLNVTYQRAIEGAPENRLFVVSRFSNGLPVGLEESLRRIPGVASVGAWASVCGHYGAEQKFTCVFTADDGMQAAFPFPIDAVNWKLLMSTVDGVLVSHKSALAMDLKVGDVLTLVVPVTFRGDGAPSWPFKVIGIVPDSPEWAHGYRVGNLKYFQNNRPLPLQGEIAGFRLGLTATARANEVARTVDRFFENSGTPTNSFSAREEAANSYRSVIDMALLTRLVAGAGLFMILYLTANVIARAVKERTPEMGVLQAIGFSNGRLMALVCAEAAIPCLLGAAFGTWIATLLSPVSHRWLPSGMGLPEATVSAIVWGEALGAAAMLALLSSALPILMLWRRRPAELLAAS